MSDDGPPPTRFIPLPAQDRTARSSERADARAAPAPQPLSADALPGSHTRRIQAGDLPFARSGGPRQTTFMRLSQSRERFWRGAAVMLFLLGLLIALAILLWPTV